MSYRKVLNRRSKKLVRNQEKMKKKGFVISQPTTQRPLRPKTDEYIQAEITAEKMRQELLNELN
jgi:hypothetical protein